MVLLTKAVVMTQHMVCLNGLLVLFRLVLLISGYIHLQLSYKVLLCQRVFLETAKTKLRHHVILVQKDQATCVRKEQPQWVGYRRSKFIRTKAVGQW